MSADDSPERSLDALLRRGVNGVIEKRQTTYWDVTVGLDGSAHRYRVHVHGKAEMRFVARTFAGGGIFDEHALLANYRGRQSRVNISAPTADADGVCSDLDRTVAEWSDGWRTASEYEGAIELVLRHGNGVLFTGPDSLVRRIVEIAARWRLGP